MEKRLSKTLAPTVDTALAYTAGDLLGGKLSLLAATEIFGRVIKIIDVVVTDAGAQEAGLDMIIFKSDPTNTTFTDQAALDIADADLGKIVGIVPVAAGDYHSFASNSAAYVDRDTVKMPEFILDQIEEIFVALVTRGTPTYVAADDLNLLIQIEQAGQLSGNLVE